MWMLDMGLDGICTLSAYLLWVSKQPWRMGSDADGWMSSGGVCVPNQLTYVYSQA